jgi:hypothetical protein
MSKIRRQQAIILERETLLQGFFHVELLKLQHTLQGGELSPAIDRLVLQRPDAVCAVVVHQERQSLFFVRQFRTGVFEKDHGWLIELAAGLVDEGETPEQAVKREIMEELGFAPVLVELMQ